VSQLRSRLGRSGPDEAAPAARPAAAAGAAERDRATGGIGYTARVEAATTYTRRLLDSGSAGIKKKPVGSSIGLSAAPTWRRVKWLEQQRYITGYRAELDRRRVGLGVLAFVRVDAERNNASATRALEEAIRALPEVVACHYISGAGTFELQVVVTDLDAYSRWARETLFKLPNVKDIHTSFSLGEVKSGAALPLSHLRA